MNEDPCTKACDTPSAGVAYHNGNQFVVTYSGPESTVAFGPFTIDKAHEFIGALREAGHGANQFRVIRFSQVAAPLF